MNTNYSKYTGFIILIAILMGFFTWGAWHLKTVQYFAFDRPMIQFVQHWKHPLLTSLMKFYAWFGSMPIVFLLTFMIFIILRFYFKRLVLAWMFLITIFITAGCNQLLKFMFQRERPTFDRMIEIGGFSFPSGHAMMATSFYGLLVLTIWQLTDRTIIRAVTLIFAIGSFCMITVSRVYLGVHYPSDIIAGIFASAIILTTSYFFYRKSQVHEQM